MLLKYVTFKEKDLCESAFKYLRKLCKVTMGRYLIYYSNCFTCEEK